MNAPLNDQLISAFLDRREALRRAFAAKAGPSAAEDLLQELYLRVAQTEPEHPIHNPDGYLFRLAFNLLIDRRRSDQRRQARDAMWRNDHVDLCEGDAVDPSPPADQALAARERLAQVMAVVSRLPPQTQTVFRLHKIEQLSYREVAARLGVSVSAVEKHMTRALQRIQTPAPR